MTYSYTHILIIADKKSGLVTRTYYIKTDEEYLEIVDNLDSKEWFVKSFK